MVRSLVRRCGPIALWLAAAGILGGCSKEELGELVDKAKETAVEGGQAVNQSLKKVSEDAADKFSTESLTTALTGDMKLNAGKEVTASACNARLIDVGDRGRVLQVASYDLSAAKEGAYPHVFAQARVEGATIESLQGKSFPAELFIQSQSSDPILYAAPGAEVELKISAVDGRKATIEVSGQLRDSASDADVPVSGAMNAVIPESAAP